MKQSTSQIEQVAIACQNNAVPAKAQASSVAGGTWITDFGTGHSFRSEDKAQKPRSKATEVFNRTREASQAGGKGTLRAKHTDLVAVGYFGTDGIRLIDHIGDKDQDMKGLQFEEYAVLGPGDEEYEEASTLADTQGGTVAGLTDAKKERLEDLLERLRIKGLLRSPTR